MNREGQVYYRQSWHVVLLVVRSYLDINSEWSHDLIALSDLEELPGPSMVGHLYTWTERAARLDDSGSVWGRL